MRERLFVGRDYDNGGIDVELPPTGLLVFGPSGCGKTTGIALRAIRDWPGPVVAVSSSTNLYDLTSGAESGVGRSQLGPVSVFDPLSRLSSGRHETWEVLRGCRDVGIATDRTGDMLFGAWTGLTVAPVGDVIPPLGDIAEHTKPVFHLLRTAAASGDGLRMLGSWASSGDWANAAAWIRHFNNGPPGDEAAYLALLTPPHVQETVRSVFGLFNVPSVVAATSTTSFDASAFMSQISTLYVVSDRSVAPLTSAFLGELTRTFRYWLQQGYRPNPPLLLVIDDLSNAANWYGMSDLLSKGPAWGIIPVFLTQKVDTKPGLLSLELIANAGESRSLIFREQIELYEPAADPAAKWEAAIGFLRDTMTTGAVIRLTIPNALADGWDPALQPD